MSSTASENQYKWLLPPFMICSSLVPPSYFLDLLHKNATGPRQSETIYLFIFPLWLNSWHPISGFNFKCLCVTLSMQHKEKYIFLHGLRDSECQQLVLIFLVYISSLWALGHRSQQNGVKSGPAYLRGLESTFVWLWREINMLLWQIDARIYISCRCLWANRTEKAWNYIDKTCL